MPKATPESTATGAEAVVLEYMQAQNRPYAATDVHLNLRGKVTKAAVLRALGALTTHGDLTKKEYGKSVLFVVKQSSLTVLDDAKLQELKEATKANKEQLEELQRKNKRITGELNAVLATPTNAEIPEQIAMAQAKRDALRAQVEEKQAQLKDLPSLAQEQAHNLDQSLSFWRKTWVARRTAEAELMGLIQDAGSNAGGELQEQARDLVEDLPLSPDDAKEAEYKFKLGH